MPTPTPPKTVPYWAQRTMHTSELRTGMTTLRDGKADCILKSYEYRGACKGFHFRTADERTVCYLPGNVTVFDSEVYKMFKDVFKPGSQKLSEAITLVRARSMIREILS